MEAVIAIIIVATLIMVLTFFSERNLKDKRKKFYQLKLVSTMDFISSIKADKKIEDKND